MAPARRDPARSARPFRLRDVLKQVTVQDLAVAPDGSAIIYGRKVIEGGTYRKALWRTTFRVAVPNASLAADMNATRPGFAPDGSALLFLSERSGRSQPWVSRSPAVNPACWWTSPVM